MKTAAVYSQKKFQSFNTDGRIKALGKVLDALEAALDDPFRRGELLDQARSCLSWLEKPLPDDIEKISVELSDSSDPHRISSAIAAFRTSRGLTFTDSQLLLRQSDGPRDADPAMQNRAGQMIAILDNLRSAFNVGSIFRSAECLGLRELWLCGVTATPETDALRKTAMGTENRVKWRYFSETASALEQARSAGFRIYALETSPAATSVFQTDFRLPLALLMGNESLGLAPEILAQSDAQICLPVQGWKNSLNVAVAFSVCAYQIVCGDRTC